MAKSLRQTDKPISGISRTGGAGCAPSVKPSARDSLRPVAGLISHGERPGSEPRDQNHHHAREGTERAAPEDRLLEAVRELARGQGHLAHGPPGYRHVAQQVVDHGLQLPDTEEPGMVVNRW